MKYLTKTFIVSIGLLAFTLSGCSSPVKSGIPGIPGVYKIDVQQGNIITQEMIDQLRPGMTKQQIQFVMGTPLILDTFSPDRWDYIYSTQPGGKKRRQESVSLFFENDQLTHFVGDFIPTQAIKK